MPSGAMMPFQAQVTDNFSQKKEMITKQLFVPA
jgi:hypothetical protein